ncbi:MAG: ABC transporter permease, partial [Bacteroidota bacterium]
MACVVLVALFVRHETGFDAFHERGDRIVRMDLDEVTGEDVEPRSSTPGLLAPALRASVPEVEAAVRMLSGQPVFRVDGELFEPGQIYYADPEVLRVFSFPLVAGDPATALDAPGQIVLDETTARALFGGTDVLGETLGSGSETLTVTGVMADVPSQSHLQFRALASLSTLDDPGWYYTNWRSTNFLTYTLLREGADLDAFQSRLPALIDAEAGDELASADYDFALRATPLADLYLYADRNAGDVQGSLQILQVLSVIALFVLLIAGVNFTNLATARSLDRAREVGVRKTLGAQRGGLVARFLTEAVLLCLVALALGFGIAALALPGFESLTGKTLALADLGVWTLGLAGLAVGVGLLAGTYPALVLSGFHPAEVLKGRFATGTRGATLRRALVVVQFTVSIALIAATVVVFNQVDYMQSRDLGLDLGGDQTQLVVLPYEAGDPQNPFGATEGVSLEQAKRRLLDVRGVSGVTSSLAAPTGGQASAGGELELASGEAADFSVTMYMVDTSFVRVYGLDLVAGVAPGAATLADSSAAYVLNETAVREAGYATPEAALGARASFWGGEGEVVGVVRDFHVTGLQSRIEPLALVASEDFQSVLTLRVQTAGLPETLAALGGLWPELVPTRPFTYSFLDEDFGAQYAAEQRFSRVFGVLSGLAIAIACLGLFGLAAYEIGMRTKEIGVRRVLGATVGQVVVLLSRGVVPLVVIGAVVAAPLVAVGMSRWLDGFAYRIAVGWEPLAVAGALVLAVALVTVAGQAFRAAVADPVRALRSE